MLFGCFFVFCFGDCVICKRKGDMETAEMTRDRERRKKTKKGRKQLPCRRRE
jgi:hypothetical protein